MGGGEGRSAQGREESEQQQSMIYLLSTSLHYNFIHLKNNLFELSWMSMDLVSLNRYVIFIKIDYS